MAQLVVSLKDRELGRHAISAQTRIGRDPACEVCIDNVGISRLHATVAWDGRGYHVVDQQSANGVFVNGQPIQNQYLSDGDVIQIGKFSLLFTLVDAPAAAGAPGQSSTQPAAPATRGRAIQQTLALGPEEVHKLLRSHSEPPAPGSEPKAASLAHRAELEGPDQGLRLLFFGLGGVVLIGVIGYFLMIH
jgi:pSer/pThr/pTyr-binding forkhead associated (FHA) protein